jgi:O-antigen/teichoic acid export membrane protein
MRGFLGASFRSFSGRIIGAASVLVASFAVTTTLTIEESGVFFLGLGFAMFFSHVLKFGLDTYALKKCSIFLAEARHGEFVAMGVVSTLICIAGGLVFYALSYLAQLAGVYEYARIVVLFFPAAIAMALMGVIAHSLHAMGHVFTGTVSNIALNYLFFSLCFLFFQPADAVAAIGYFTASCYLALLIQLFTTGLLYKRSGVALPQWGNSQLSQFDYRDAYATTIPLWIVVIAQQLNLRGAQFISSVHISESDIALLAIAMRVALVVPMLLTSVNIVVSPKFATYYHAGEMAKLEQVLQKSIQLLAIVATAVFIGVIFFGEYVLSIFGPENVEARVLLSILVCGQLVSALTGPSGRLLLMSGFEKDFRNASVVVTVLGLVLAYFLASNYGVYGAAIATAVTIGAQNIFLAYLVESRVNINILKIYANLFRRVPR